MYTHGARKSKIYLNKKSITRPIIILIAHFFRLLLATTSCPPANDQAIPKPTIASTPRRRTILIRNLISLANTNWNPSRPGGTLHLYNRVVIFPQALSHWPGITDGVPSFSYTVLSWAQSTAHSHTAPGTFSDVKIVGREKVSICLIKLSN